jgi:hypothetical protein
MLLRAAGRLAPDADRRWAEAMQSDFYAAESDGRGLAWAFGCLVAALRLRITSFRHSTFDRPVANELVLYAVAFVVIVFSMIVVPSTWLMARIANAFAVVPLGFFICALGGGVATGISVIVLLLRYRTLPRRIAQPLWFERGLGSLRVRHGNELTSPREQLISGTAGPALLLFQAVWMLLTTTSSELLHMTEWLCVFDTALCIGNTFSVFARIQFPRGRSTPLR